MKGDDDDERGGQNHTHTRKKEQKELRQYGLNKKIERNREE